MYIYIIICVYIYIWSWGSCPSTAGRSGHPQGRRLLGSFHRREAPRPGCGSLSRSTWSSPPIFFIIGRSTTRVKWPMIQSHRRYVDPSQEPLSHENQKVSHLPRDHLFDQNLSSSVPYITYDSILSHILPVRPHWPIWTPQKSQLFCEVGGVRQWRSRKIRQGRPGASGVSGQPGGLLRTGGLGWPGWSFFLGNKCYPKKRGWGLLGIMMQLGNAIFGYDIVIIVISVSWFRVTG